MIQLKNFIDLTLEEKKMVLSWRNNPSIKSMMHNSFDITLENHLMFIESLKYKSDKKYFLVKENNTPVGVIDFIDITKEEAELGIYSNPELKGYGKILLEEICIYAFEVLKIKTLKAEVYASNTKAIKLYETFDFIKVNQKTIDDKEIIYMELYNENR